MGCTKNWFSVNSTRQNGCSLFLGSFSIYIWLLCWLLLFSYFKWLKAAAPSLVPFLCLVTQSCSFFQLADSLQIELQGLPFQKRRNHIVNCGSVFSLGARALKLVQHQTPSFYLQLVSFLTLEDDYSVPLCSSGLDLPGHSDSCLSLAFHLAASLVDTSFLQFLSDMLPAAWFFRLASQCLHLLLGSLFLPSSSREALTAQNSASLLWHSVPSWVTSLSFDWVQLLHRQAALPPETWYSPLPALGLWWGIFL